MEFHRAGRRSSGRSGSKRLGEKVFSYHTPEEKRRLQLAADRQDLSLSSFVAKAANAEADRILGPSGAEVLRPLSLRGLIQVLKQQDDESNLVSLIRRTGVDFKLSRATERTLRRAGAGPEILLELYKATNVR